jgi:hypothetical protein
MSTPCKKKERERERRRNEHVQKDSDWMKEAKELFPCVISSCAFPDAISVIAYGRQ